MRGGILDDIEANDYNVLFGGAHLTTWDKISRLPAIWRLAPHWPSLTDPVFAGTSVVLITCTGNIRRQPSCRVVVTDHQGL